jgi:hypothetical protein
MGAMYPNNRSRARLGRTPQQRSPTISSVGFRQLRTAEQTYRPNQAIVLPVDMASRDDDATKASAQVDVIGV